ncbi:unnamed protein product [Parnassius mnemosyne]|uniref:Uncharacterized protein n=1 Tax=Parnassius mnemosyne TaxID=213953 RepID=A0AAV1M1K4_9NEOP
MHTWNNNNILKESSSDESPGVGLSLNRSQHDAALPSTTPRQERKSSTDYSELRHRTEVNSDPRRHGARVKNDNTDRRDPNGLRRRTARVQSDYSRSLLMGEQSNAWRILLRNDRKSRHRRIKKQRRYERLAATSQLSLW